MSSEDPAPGTLMSISVSEVPKSSRWNIQPSGHARLLTIHSWAPSSERNPSKAYYSRCAVGLPSASGLWPTKGRVNELKKKTSQENSNVLRAPGSLPEIFPQSSRPTSSSRLWTTKHIWLYFLCPPALEHGNHEGRKFNLLLGNPYVGGDISPHITAEWAEEF